MVRSQQATNASRTEKIMDASTKHRSNPSAWNIRIVIAVLAAVDFLLASYMALYQWCVIDSVWDPLFGSQQSQLVLDSVVSQAFRRIFIIPDAALGAAAYLAEIILALVGSQQRWRTQPWLVMLFGANALTVALVGVALVVLQATVVKAWCLLCLTTAVLSIIMLILALPEVLASMKYLQNRKICFKIAAIWNDNCK